MGQEATQSRAQSQSQYDAIVVGAGPNGLTAAIELARNDLSVLLVEAADRVGGGVRSDDALGPGTVRDICSTAYPMAVNSRAFRRWNLERFGLEWVYAPTPLAHPFDDGSAATLEYSVDETAEMLGDPAYRDFMGPLVENLPKITRGVMGPIRIPRNPLVLARFGLNALRSAEGLARARLNTPQARALFAGIAAHGFLPLHIIASAAPALMLGAHGHADGWPFVRGGAQQLSDAMRKHFESLGGTVQTGWKVSTISELPQSRAVLFDLTPSQVIDILGDELPSGYVRRLEKFKRGPGVYKVDWLVDGEIPWLADECHRAGVIHLGGTMKEIATSERMVAQGGHSDRPYLLMAQASRFDSERAPEGQTVLWGYAHVPRGSTVDYTDTIERQVERFAPGFRDRILQRVVTAPADMERYNPNYIGGDISGGLMSIGQTFTRPVARWTPYGTPVERYYFCSSSSPPGGGVHGFPGYHAAQAAMRRSFG